MPLWPVPVRPQLSGPFSSWSFPLEARGDLGGDGPRNQAPPPVTQFLLPVNTGDGQFQSPLRWEEVGKNLLAVVVQGPLLLLLLMLLATACCHGQWGLGKGGRGRGWLWAH